MYIYIYIISLTHNDTQRHPWVTRDLENREEWLLKSDPRHYMNVQVTNDLEITESVTMMDRLRQSIRKLSFSFGSNSQNRRKSSMIKVVNRPVSSYHPASPNTMQNNLHRLSQPSMSKQPSFSTSLLPHATSSVIPTVSLSTGHTLIFNNSGMNSSNIIPSYLSEAEEDDDEEEDEDEDHRPGISRRVSSASSSSGLGLTFGKYQSTMTPLS